MSETAYEIKDDELNLAIAWAVPASTRGTQRVLAAAIGLDGRSPFVWLRLRNGDLALATFPRGATYEDLERETEVPSDVISNEQFPYEFRGGVHWLTVEGVRIAAFRMENGQLYVGINTENVDDKDSDPEGMPYLQVNLNDGDLYDLEKPKVDLLPADLGPYMLRCTFRPQRDVQPGRPMTDVEDIAPETLGRAWHELTWIAEYDEAPSEQRNYGSDALRDHPDVPDWIREWDGPFEIDFQVRFTVIGMYGDAQRFAEAFWADDTNHAAEQARDSARSLGADPLHIAAVLYGEQQVVA